MATKKAKLVDADGAEVTVEPAESGRGFSIPDIPAGVLVDLARIGVQFGIGLAALALENARRIADEAIDRGAKIEERAVETLAEFEREQVAYMKDYVRRAQSKARPSGGAAIEAHVEEALKTHDVPTRDDIRELHEEISRLNEKVSKLTN